MTPEQKEKRRQAQRLRRKKEKEINMTEIDRQRRAMRRAHLLQDEAEEEIMQQRMANAQRERERRTLISQEDIVEQRAAGRQKERERRALISQEDIEERRAAGRQRDRERRALISQEDIEERRAVGRQRERERRENRLPEVAEQEREAQRERQTVRRSTTSGIATHCDWVNFQSASVQQHSLGEMNVKCKHCKALGFKSENKGTQREPHFGELCCNKGQIMLAPIPSFPEPLMQLLNGTTDEDKHFQKNIRKFNSGMAMTSLQMNNRTVTTGGPGAFKIQGLLYRRIGPMLAQEG